MDNFYNVSTYRRKRTPEHNQKIKEKNTARSQITDLAIELVFADRVEGTRIFKSLKEIVQKHYGKKV